MGALVGSVVGKVAAGAIGNKLFGKSKKKSDAIARQILPEQINTGNSVYNTRTGKFELDPSIRRMQDSYLQNTKNIGQQTAGAFDIYGRGIEGLQGRSEAMRSDFEGNQSAYRDAMLNPLREAIARREGQLDRELGRTKVRGSFAEGAKTNLAFDSARQLVDAEARIENERINKLGDFLNMDADLLKQGLASDTGRTAALQAIEDATAGLSMDRFNQEMAMLGLPASFTTGAQASAALQANALGRVTEQRVKFAGDLLEAGGQLFSGSGSGGEFGTEMFQGVSGASDDDIFGFSDSTDGLSF